MAEKGHGTRRPLSLHGLQPARCGLEQAHILSSYRFDAFAPFLLSPHYYSQSIGSQAEGHDLKKVG